MADLRERVANYCKPAKPCTCDPEEVEHWTVGLRPCDAHPDRLEGIARGTETDYDRQYRGMRDQWDAVRREAGLTTTRKQIREMTTMAKDAPPERKRAWPGESQ